jgi:type IV pilus assembly protein PilW
MSRPVYLPLYRQAGLTLVELLISILLGVMLSLGMASIYVNAKVNYSNEEEAARMQENGRYAISLLKRELTQAGFYAGTPSIARMASAAVTTDCAGGNWALDASTPVELISDYSGTATTINGTTFTCLTESGTTPIVSGSDVVSVKRTASDYTLKDGEYANGVTTPQANQWYVRLESYGSTKAWEYVGSSPAFSAGVGAGSEVDFWEFYSSIYYLRNYSQTAGDDIPSLCVVELAADNMTRRCLVEGVEDMQIEFGLDTDNDGVPNRFKGTPTSAEMSGAVVARIYLLLRSVNPVGNGYTNAKAYQLGQKPVPAKNDGYLRRVMTTTVQMRNSILPLTS